jgi:predicted alpha/beta hydrolase
MMEFVDKNGYFDGRSFGMGGLLPAAALRMWAHWTSFQQYAAGDPAFRDIYRDFRMSFTSLAFSDDVQVMLSPHTVKNWCKSLSNAPSTLIMYDAEQFGLQIGHNDAFRERNQTLWERSFDKWVNDESMEGAASSSRSFAKL